MRARSREVNIFNMSLLDILCGALGAFCFMMLVLLPYYKPPASEEGLRQQQATTDELLNELEKLKEQAKDSALAKQMQDLIDRLQDQVKQLQGQVNQYASQNQQLQAENQQIKSENDNLTKQNQDQKRSLDQRRPFIALVTSNPVQNVNLYLWDDSLNQQKKGAAPFDPNKQPQWPSWTGDTLTWLNGASAWVVRDSPPNIHYKVYVKLTNEPATRAATTVSGSIVGESAQWVVNLPQVSLTPTRFWEFLGTITGGEEGKTSFEPATAEQQEAEWKKISGAAPPPAVTATPAVQRATPPGLSKEEMDKRRQEYIKRRQQGQSPTAVPAKSP
ncbi:MAG TPA: hypothetical protein VJ719_13895 [Chthoniobacterales bacterium]|nr:hypothetical protein [Chthoniobacterales bacterium]